MILCINERLPPGDHPRESRGICRGCQLFVAPGCRGKYCFCSQSLQPRGQTLGICWSAVYPIDNSQILFKVFTSCPCRTRFRAWINQVSFLRSPILGSTQSPNFMYIPRTHSAQKPYILRSLSPIGFGHFSSFLRKKKKRKKETLFTQGKLHYYW